MSESESTDRPTASGHRFGPDLACAECGISWDEHQRDPSPCCRKEAEASAPGRSGKTRGVFERRPSDDPEKPASPASSKEQDPRATQHTSTEPASATGAGKGKS